MNHLNIKNTFDMKITSVIFCFVCLFVWAIPIEARDRQAQVLLDCREGIGMLPNMWRGLTLQTGDLPEDMTLRTVCLGPEPVAQAWNMRRRGGEYDWQPLDEALTRLHQQGEDVVLVLPVPQYPDSHWEELIVETVRHVGDRVVLYEFRASRHTDLEHYLTYYENGVWAVHQLGFNVRMGGPGTDWTQENVEALIRRCSERNLPFHALTWHVAVKDDDAIRRSIDQANQWVRQYPLDRLPSRMITGWDAKESDFRVGLSALMGAMNSDVQVIALADTNDVSGWMAMKGLNQVASIRLPVVIQAPDGGVSGVAHLDYDTVLAVFWHARAEGQTPISATFSGLPWGDQIRVEQLRLTEESGDLKPVFSETRPFLEPMSVNFVLTGDAITVVKLVVE